MANSIIDLNINNYSSCSNSLGLKLSGKGYTDSSNTTYNQNGIGMVLWTNSSNNISNKEFAFVDTDKLNSNSSNSTLRIGLNYPEISIKSIATDNSYVKASINDFLYIDKNINLGIGINSPSNLLHIHNSNQNYYCAFQISDGLSKGLIISKEQNEDVNIINYYPTGNLILGVSNADKLTINSNGNVNIGILTENQNQNYKLDVNGIINSLDVKINNTSLSNTYISSNILGIQNFVNSNFIFNSISTDFIKTPLESSNKFIVNDSYTNDITFKRNVFSSNIITSNLFVIDNYTVLNTSVYQTEQLEINNEATATALKVSQKSSLQNVAEFYYNTTNSALIINNNGNVGIGTASPAYKLDVVGTINASGNISANGLTINGNGASIGSITDATGLNFTTAATKEIVFTQAAEVMRIHTDGNVGIGTASPAYKLDVNGDIKSCNINLNATIPTITAPNKLFITTGEAKEIVFTQAAEVMRIHTNGNVGIGIASPAYKLDVVGTIKGNSLTATTGDITATLGNISASAGNISASGTITGNSLTATTGGITATAGGITANSGNITATSGSITTNGLTINGNGTSIGSITDTTGLNFITATSKEIVFTQDAEVMRISSNGNIGIGKTNPQYTFDVNGTINCTQLLNNGLPVSTSSGSSFNNSYSLNTIIYDMTLSNNNFSNNTYFTTDKNNVSYIYFNNEINNSIKLLPDTNYTINFNSNTSNGFGNINLYNVSTFPNVYDVNSNIMNPLLWYKFDKNNPTLNNGSNDAYIDYPISLVRADLFTSSFVKYRGDLSYLLSYAANSYINITNNINFKNIQTTLGITFSFWFKNNNTWKNDQNTFATPKYPGCLLIIGEKEYISSYKKINYLYIIHNSSGFICFSIGLNTSSETLYVSNINCYDNNWHHILWSISNTGVWTIYIDGINLNVTISMSMITISDILKTQNYIGFWFDDANTSYCYGYISDFRIYSFSLTTSQILSLYNNTLIYTYKNYNTINNEYNDNITPTIWYKFDNNLLDSSGNNNTLIQTGGNNITFNSNISYKGSYSLVPSINTKDTLLQLQSTNTYTIDNETNCITISFWYYISFVLDSYDTLIYSYSGQNCSIQRSGATNFLAFKFAGSDWFTSTINYNVDYKWHHLVMIGKKYRTASRIIIYLDGNYNSDNGVIGTGTWTPYKEKFGVYGGSSSAIANLDDLRIYIGTILTSDQIYNLFNNTATFFHIANNQLTYTESNITYTQLTNNLNVYGNIKCRDVYIDDISLLKKIDNKYENNTIIYDERITNNTTYLTSNYTNNYILFNNNNFINVNSNNYYQIEFKDNNIIVYDKTLFPIIYNTKNDNSIYLTCLTPSFWFKFDKNNFLANTGNNSFFIANKKLTSGNSCTYTTLNTYRGNASANFIATSNNFLSYNSPALYYLNYYGMTFTLWAKITSNSGVNARLFEFGNKTATFYLSLSKDSGNNINFTNKSTTAGNSASYIYNAQNLIDNNWHFYAWTINSSNSLINSDVNAWSFYIDKNYINPNISSVIDVSTGSSTWSNCIGKSILSDNDSYLDGCINDFRVYNTVLTSNQISTIYNNTIIYTDNSYTIVKNNNITIDPDIWFKFDKNDFLLNSGTEGGLLKNVNNVSYSTISNSGKNSAYFSNNDVYINKYLYFNSKTILGTKSFLFTGWIYNLNNLNYDFSPIVSIGFDFWYFYAIRLSYNNKFKRYSISCTTSSGAKSESIFTVENEYNKWIHIMLNFNFNTQSIHFYRNGVLVASIPFFLNLDINSSQNIHFGYDKYSGTIMIFNGYMCDLRFYIDKNLTIDQMLSIYNKSVNFYHILDNNIKYTEKTLTYDGTLIHGNIQNNYGGKYSYTNLLNNPTIIIGTTTYTNFVNLTKISNYDEYYYSFIDTSAPKTMTVSKDIYCDILVVGGGGSGGGNDVYKEGGGGGAGAYIYKKNYLLKADVTYNITIGKGGINNSNGEDTIVKYNQEIIFLAKGGGYGEYIDGGIRFQGNSGGSCGGVNDLGVGDYYYNTVYRTNFVLSNNIPLGKYGNLGGIGYSTDSELSSYSIFGGGGGAGTPGFNTFEDSNYKGYGGDGGDGLFNDITGENIYYSGGGGGGVYIDPGYSSTTYGGKGGKGGGGYGTCSDGFDFPGKPYAYNHNGINNTGGGGGGGYIDSTLPTGNGGSGVVIIRFKPSKIVEDNTGLLLNCYNTTEIAVNNNSSYTSLLYYDNFNVSIGRNMGWGFLDNLNILSKNVYFSGNVGIGMSSDAIYKLNINGSVNVTTLYINGIDINSLYSPLQSSGTTTITGNLAVSTIIAPTTLSLKTGNDNSIDKLSILSSGNIGIGITTPAKLLHLHNTTSGTSLGMQITDGGTNITSTSGISFFKGSDNSANIMNYSTLPTGLLNLGTNGINRLIITRDGGVGIGNTTNMTSYNTFFITDVYNLFSTLPTGNNSAVFKVESSSTNVLNVRNNTDNTNVIATFAKNTNLTGISICQDGLINTGSTADQNFHISSKGTGKIRLNNSNLVITNTGNIGIGTLSPTNLLHLHNTTSGTSLGMQITDGFISTMSATSGIRFFKNTDHSANIINYHATASLLLGTNGTTRLTISKDGLVGIGTAIPSSFLHLHSTGNPGSLGIQITDYATGIATTNGINIFKGTDHSANIINYFATASLILGTNGNTRLTISSAGHVGIGTAAIASTTAPTTNACLTVQGDINSYGEVTAFVSDMRLKTKISNIKNAVSIIENINGFRYTGNDLAMKYGLSSEKNRFKEYIGVSAQEVNNVLPEIVSLAPFDMANDSEGNLISKTGENFLTVKYDKLTPVLIEALKELKKEILFNKINSCYDYIPNIYKICECSLNIIKTNYDITKNIKINDKIKIISNNINKIFIITNIIDNYTFTINENINDSYVFVYGTYIENIQSLNKNNLLELVDNTNDELYKIINNLKIDVSNLYKLIQK